MEKTKHIVPELVFNSVNIALFRTAIYMYFKKNPKSLCIIGEICKTFKAVSLASLNK